MIKRKGVSKGDIVQSIKNIDIACQNMYRHILLLDDVIAKYIDMKGDGDKLQKFINKSIFQSKKIRWMQKNDWKN